MGWKLLKEHFDIKHIVHVTSEGVCIGSGYVHDLVVIDPKTGKVTENPTFSLLKDAYPALKAAAPDELVRLIEAEDSFSAAMPVFTWKDSEIIEKVCEQPGWPNVTHDGRLMYDNLYSTDKTTVVGWAKRDAQIAIRFTRDSIAETERTLAERKAELLDHESALATLNAAYPSVELVVDQR